MSGQEDNKTGTQCGFFPVPLASSSSQFEQLPNPHPKCSRSWCRKWINKRIGLADVEESYLEAKQDKGAEQTFLHISLCSTGKSSAYRNARDWVTVAVPAQSSFLQQWELFVQRLKSEHNTKPQKNITWLLLD